MSFILLHARMARMAILCLVGALSIAGCGSGTIPAGGDGTNPPPVDGADPDDGDSAAPDPIDRLDPEIVDPQAVNGRVLMPGGSAAQNLRVLTNPGTVAVGADGSFNAQVISTGPTLAVLVDASGLRMLGFLNSGESEQEISARSTAVALLYFSLGGWTLPPNALPELLALISSSDACDELATTLDDILAKEPTALQTGDIWVSVAVGGATEKILKSAAESAGRKRLVEVAQRAADEDLFLVIDPAEAQSGIHVQSGTGNSFTYRNSYLRRAVLYVLRTEEEDLFGKRTSVSPAELVGQPISVSGASELLPTVRVTDLTLVGPSGWRAASGDPVDLPITSDRVSATYEIVAIGAALDEVVTPAILSDPQFVTFHEEWRARIEEEVINTFIFGFLVPLTEQIGIGTRIGIPESAASSTADALAELIRPVLREQSVSLDDSGDIYRAIKAILDRMSTTSAFRESMTDALLSAYESRTGSRLKREAILENLEALAGAGSLQAAIYDSMNGIDLGRLLESLKQSSQAVSWTAEVGTVRIRPAAPTVSRESPTVLLRAETAGDSPTGGLCYEWTNSANTGSISTDLGEAGISFMTREPTVQYLAPPSSVIEADLDTVSVRVFENPGGTGAACPDSFADDAYVGSASVVVRGEEFDETPCTNFPEGAYVGSDLLTLRINPSVVRPGEQINATVSYALGHPLSPGGSVSVELWCAYACGHCGPGRCGCDPGELDRMLIDGSIEGYADRGSVPYVTALGKRSDREGLRVPCAAHVRKYFTASDPEAPETVTHTFTFTIHEDWAPCPPYTPDCRCPVLLENDPDIVSERNVWSGPFIVARAERLQVPDSRTQTTETVARVFNFSVDPDVNTDNPPSCP